MTGDLRLHQPAGWARTAMIRDDAAPHQIRIGEKGLTWSCTCQAIATGPGYATATKR